MNRAIFVCALFTASAAFLAAQQSAQSNPYQGVSHPPPDSTIIDEAPPQPVPPIVLPAQPKQSAPAAKPAPKASTPAQTQSQQPATTHTSTPGYPYADGTDGGIVKVASTPDAQTPAYEPNEPTVWARIYASVPDGDIVHPQPPPPGEVGYGTIIHVRLLDQLSTANNQPGDTFRSRVTQDVYEDGNVVIPAGSEINGTVVRVSSGSFGAGGYMDLRPDTVTLPDGKRYRMYAMVSGTPGSHARVGAEGTITPGRQWKRYGIEYGGGVGAGAATGAVLGGPAGALAGTVIGAAVITAHLLVSHPQATLEPGSKLLFTLTEPLDLVPAAQGGAAKGPVLHQDPAEAYTGGSASTTGTPGGGLK